MTDGVLIDFGHMDELVEAISKANGSISASLGRLDTTVAQLGGEWAGDASDSYRVAHKQWAESLSEMNRILGQISSTTGGITQRHRDTESKVRGLWS
jgi:WXG100 family type VII secretion target